MTVIQITQPTPALVVFGRDQAGKPHASWFDQDSVALATKAAGLMNMQAVPIEGDALRELAGTLPRGRVFSSGRAFTPFIKGKLYDRLTELTRELLGLTPAAAANGNMAAEDGNGAQAGAGTTNEPPASAVAAGEQQGSALDTTVPPPAKVPGNPRPSAADQVGLGSLVLAAAGPGEGWFEAEVIGINGGSCTLRWRDYNEPSIVRRPTELGFLPAIAV